MSVKITVFLSCVLDTLVLLVFKALIPVGDEFKTEICHVKKIGITLIIVQNILLIVFLCLSISNLLTFLFVPLAANFIPLLFAVCSIYRKQKSLHSNLSVTKTANEQNI